MKCTAKNMFWSISMKFPPWRWISSAMSMPLHSPSILSISRQKYVKNINMKRDTQLVETSHGQIWYYYEQADLWSDVPPSPPLEASHGQVWYYIEQADPRQRHLVDMCITPWSHRSDVPPPPGRDISWPCLVLL